MRHSASAIAAVVCMAGPASGQFELRYDSTVTVSYRTQPFGGQLVTVEDNLSGTRALETFDKEHAVSYTDPLVGYDPTASCRFSVDQITEIVPSTSPPFRDFEISISGELYRRGPGPIILTFEEATSDLSIELDGLTETVISGVLSYEASVTYTSDQAFDLGPQFYLPSLEVYGVQSNGTETLLDEFDTSGSTRSGVLNQTGNDAGFNFDSIRIDVRSDLHTQLGSHPGETSVGFEITLRVLTNSDFTLPCLPDVNDDGMLSPADFSAWIAAFNTSAPECDQNGDGACTPADFSAWVANYNAGCD